MHFMALEKSRKLSGFVIYTYLRCKVLNKVCERGTISVKNGILNGKGISLTVLKFVFGKFVLASSSSFF